MVLKNGHRIAWLFPPPIKGSGGHRTIVQQSQALAEKGYRQTFFVLNDGSFGGVSVSDKERLRILLEEWYGEVSGAEYELGWPKKLDAVEYGAVFATLYASAEVVARYDSSIQKFYFVQDFEAMFNPVGDEYMKAVYSYFIDLKCITIGRWLTKKLRSEYGRIARYYNFGVDTSIYQSAQSGWARDTGVCFIYQPDKARRCSQMGIDALKIVKKLRPSAKVILYGSKHKGPSDLEHVNFGLLPPSKCNELYNLVTVGLCISATNPSRIPYEMMASGLCVVDIFGDNNLYDHVDGAVKLAAPTPEGIAYSIVNILDSVETRNSMRSRAAEFIAERHVEREKEQFVAAFEDLFVGGEAYEDAIVPSYRAACSMAPQRFLESIELEGKPVVFSKRLESTLLGKVRRRLRNTLKYLLTGRVA